MRITIKSIRVVLFILLTLCLNHRLQAQSDCLPINENRLVNDYVGSLSQSQYQSLEAKLAQYDRSTTTQIVVVIVADLCGYDKAAYTYTLAEMWGVGQKGKDNGVMIMVKPVGGTGQRHTFIAVGYGLEGVIPDAIAKRIVETEMIPRFKKDDIFGGILAATDIIMDLASGEFTAKEYKKSSSNEELVPIIIFLFFISILILGRIGRARSYARRNNLGFWAALALMGSSSRSHGGSFSGFSSGGGGFGGFGGGGFGGGGAGGSW